FERAIDEVKRAKGTTSDLDLDADDMRGLVETFKGSVREQTGKDFPSDPREQMNLAIRAVFESWNAPRAVLYRRQERIPAALGTPVYVCAMVAANCGSGSGTGGTFARDPSTGQQGV